MKFVFTTAFCSVNGSQPEAQNPFGNEEDWKEDEKEEEKEEKPAGGVPYKVRALYDYNGIESDELSFKQGL